MKKKKGQAITANNNSSIKKNINYYNNAIIIIISGLTSITLITSGILGIFFFKNNTKELLTIIDSIITKNGIKFNLTFSTLTIAVLGFGFIILAVVAFPFIFFKTNVFISLILIRIMLGISLFFIVGSILFIAFGYTAFYNYVINKNIINLLFFIIPGSLEIFYFIILILSCLSFIKKSRQRKYMTTEMKTLHSQNEINQQTTALLNNSDNQKNDKQQITGTSQQIEEVGNKGEIINNFNPQLYRRDYAGSLMFWHNFIQQPKLNDEIESLNGTIVYERPISAGGSNYINNLVPMNNNNAVSKGNNFPRGTTSITYDTKKNKNIFKKKSWKYKAKD